MNLPKPLEEKSPYKMAQMSEYELRDFMFENRAKINSLLRYLEEREKKWVCLKCEQEKLVSLGVEIDENKIFIGHTHLPSQEPQSGTASHHAAIFVEPPKEKECRHEWGGVYPSNEMKCMKCGKDYSKPEQEKECKHNWIGYSSTDVMECTKCGEKSKPELNVEVLLDEYARLWFRTASKPEDEDEVKRFPEFEGRMKEIKNLIRANLR